MIRNCKIDKDEANADHIDQREYMTASLHLNIESFIVHMRTAYKMFFEKSDESIAVPEFIDFLCQDKSIKPDQLKHLAFAIDEDDSQKISACEFFDFMIQSLEIKHENGSKVTANYIKT